MNVASKPKLRGWLHLGMLPVSVIGGAFLIATAPTPESRWSSVVFSVTAVLLFGTSALLHRGNWSASVESVIRRIDHANIYLIIAGTYTPIAALALPEQQSRVLLSIAWIGAAIGVFLRVFWTSAPRWLTTALYVIVGWIAIFFLPELVDGAGIQAVLLVLFGGILYTVGAVVYAIKRPNPSPLWFGFHEVFHALTVAAFVAHYAAVWIVVHQ